MKKQVTLGMLALTATMANQFLAPSFGIAQNSVQQKKKMQIAFAREFKLKSNSVVRFKQNDQYIIGHLYLDIKQERTTPSEQNKLNAEMIGQFYFESDEYTEEYNGQKFKTYYGLLGDSDIILDLVDVRKNDQNQKETLYIIYGCNSTLTFCQGTDAFIKFKEKTVQLSVDLKNTGIEMYNPSVTRNENGEVVDSSYWSDLLSFEEFTEVLNSNQ